MNLNDITRNASVAGATALWNGGTIEFYNTSTSSTIIVTCNLEPVAFGTPSAGVATAAAVDEATATASGTVNAYRVKTSGGASVCTGNVGLTGTGADFIFTDVVFNAGDRLAITAITYTQPAS